MKVVLDTNVFLVIIPSGSKYHIAYDELEKGRYDIVLSNDILMEYEEQLKLRYKVLLADRVLTNLLENKNIQLHGPRVQVEPHSA